MKRYVWYGLLASLILALAVACAPSDQPPDDTAADDAAADESDDGSDNGSDEDADDTDAGAEEDLDSLIAAAQEEGELVVYNTSSAVEAACASFEEVYGIQCTGFKLENPEQVERVRREVDSGNIEASTLQIADAALIVGELEPQGYVSTWVPPWLADDIPEVYHHPLTWRIAGIIFGYNTEAYPDGCPVSNVWELTEDDWRGKFGLRDPLTTPRQTDWFTAMFEDPSALEAAYESHYGEAYDGEYDNASYEFIARIAQNEPIVSGSDGDVGDGVGAPGQADPPMGIYYLGKHRDNQEGLVLGLCEGIEPFEGYDEMTQAVLVEGAPHPNAAKLFIHHLMSDEGMEAWTGAREGDRSTNPAVPPNPDDPFQTLDEFRERTMTLADVDHGVVLSTRQDVQDFWREHLNR